MRLAGKPVPLDAEETLIDAASRLAKEGGEPWQVVMPIADAKAFLMKYEGFTQEQADEWERGLREQSLMSVGKEDL